MEVISKQTEIIEAEVYKNSLNVVNRNTKILYYDCTNYFFEIEQAEGLKQYGFSKETRPNSITQMGLFMDGDGFPLAFNINSGNTNEQTTLKPLEKQIIKDFELSKFVVCTDAGLASNENRKFNAIQDRSYIVTQSGLEQRLIVSYSPKYAAYQKNVRNRQIEIAKNLISKPTPLGKSRQDDPKRFIKSTTLTQDGEIANKKVFTLNQATIEKEEMYDGFYAVCTTLEDDISEIIRINKRRWEIEESFRILKTDFKARPVYLKRDDRIKAHFTTCFLSLLIYRILEHKLNEEYTSEKIITTLKEMNFAKIKGDGYIPIYTRTELTDKLHEIFNFRTDNKITSLSQMKKFANKRRLNITTFLSIDKKCQTREYINK